eukprot:m51a1_g6566 hypothetical protein (1683) ;mRNA; r:151968-169804
MMGLTWDLTMLAGRNEGRQLLRLRDVLLGGGQPTRALLQCRSPGDIPLVIQAAHRSAVARAFGAAFDPADPIGSLLQAAASKDLSQRFGLVRKEWHEGCELDSEKVFRFTARERTVGEVLCSFAHTHNAVHVLHRQRDRTFAVQAATCGAPGTGKTRTADFVAALRDCNAEQLRGFAREARPEVQTELTDEFCGTVRSWVPLAMTFNGATPMQPASETDGRAFIAGCSLRLFLSYLFRHRSLRWEPMLQWVLSSGFQCEIADALAIIARHHAETHKQEAPVSLVICTDEIVRADGHPVAVTVGHQNARAVVSRLNAVGWREDIVVYSFTTTLDLAIMESASSSSGPLHWIPLWSPQIGATLALFQQPGGLLLQSMRLSDGDRDRLREIGMSEDFLSLVAEAGGHFRTLLELLNVACGLIKSAPEVCKRQHLWDRFLSYYARMDKALFGALSPAIYNAALGLRVSLTEVALPASGTIPEQTYAGLIRNGALCNALSEVSQAGSQIVPEFPPLRMRVWARSVLNRARPSPRELCVANALYRMTENEENWDWRQMETFHSNWEAMRMALQPGKMVMLGELYPGAKFSNPSLQSIAVYMPEEQAVFDVGSEMEYFALIVVFMVAGYLLDLYVDLRQHRCYAVREIPAEVQRLPALASKVTPESFLKSQDYGRAKSAFGLLSSAFDVAFTLAVLYTGGLRWVWDASRAALEGAGLDMRSGERPNEVLHSLAFAAGCALASHAVSLPWTLYGTHSAPCSLARHIRLHAHAPLLVCAAAAVVAACAAFDSAAASQLRVLERRQALGEATLFLGAFASELSALQKLIINAAWWDDTYEYMQGMDPGGPVWALRFAGQGFLTDVGLQSVFVVLPNGTLLNGIMWDSNQSSEVAVSPSLSAQVGARLVGQGKASGLFWIPETAMPVIVTTERVKHSDMHGDDVGWIAYARNAHSPLASIAEVADLCVALVEDTEAHSSIRSVWDVEPVTMQGQMTEGSVGVTVAPASAFVGLQLCCSSTSNQSHETYLAIGFVLSDEQGVARVRVLTRGNRDDARTINSTTRYMMLIVCLGLCLLFVLVVLLLEVFVIRILTSLSGRIVSITAGSNTSVRLKVTGKSELQSVTRAVNELLASIERRTEQTDIIMRNIFPNAVLTRIKRDESNNLTYPVTSVLFADICNFTLWSSALSPEVVTKYLNGVYSRMDEIVEHEGATKIKTIGDAYGDRNCAQVLCNGRVMANSTQPLQFRMGLASGPCSSAIVGLRKKFFDIWGPSVTMSQQIQESALPGELLCCNATRLALEASSAVTFAFSPAGAETAKAWKMSWDAGDTPRTECASARSPSSVRLLSVVEGDAGIQYSAEAKVGAVARVTSSLRFGILVGNAVLVLVFAGAVAGFLALTTSATTAALMSHRSRADMGRVSHALASALANLRLVSRSWGQWDAVIEYVAEGVPDGAFWRVYHADGVIYNVQGVDGVLYFQSNGTLVNSDGYNYAAGAQRKLSSAEKAVVGAQLLRTGEVLGLVWDPQTNVTRLAASYPVGAPGDAVVGWVVFLKDLARVVPIKADTMGMCLGALYQQPPSGPLAAVWPGSFSTTIGSNVDSSTDESSSIVIESIMFSDVLYCSSTANQSHETNLAILSDEQGVARVHVLTRGNRDDDETIIAPLMGLAPATRYMILIVCLGLCLLFISVVVLLL